MVITLPSDKELDQILKRDFTSGFRSGYVQVKGVTLPKRFEDLYDDISNWNVNEKDVWICSFPQNRVSALFDFRKYKKENVDFQPPPFLDDSLKFVQEKSKEGILCLKTHLPWSLLPNQIQSNTKNPKIIYVSRNPQDTCLSYYNHSRLMEGYRGNFEDFCNLFLAGKLPYAPFWNHVLPFWERRHRSNILFLKYEEMIKNLPLVIEQVADFLEKPLTNEQISILTDHLSFESMKKNPSVNYEAIVSFNKKFKLIECEGSFMRSGKVGDYKAKMSNEIVEKFDNWVKENVKDTDFLY